MIVVERKHRRNNNYKEYPESVLVRLQTIKRLKNFGFTLNESAEVLDMIDIKEATCNNVNELIDKKVQLLDTKILDMIALRNQLLSGVKKCIDCCNPASPEENCTILVSDNFLKV